MVKNFQQRNVETIVKEKSLSKTRKIVKQINN